MSEEQILEQPVVEEKEYRYQPTDDEGRPIGGIQVLKYTTQDELVEKIREQNILLIRKLRQETKKNRLGIVETEQLPDDVAKFGGFTEFKPREFSDDERIELARRLQDPTTAFDAVNEIVEARVGAPLDQVGPKMNTLEQENLQLKARIEANAFVADNPDYYKCQENFEAITSWMVRYNLDPVKANYQKAYDTLRAQGVMILGPAEVKNIPAPPEPVQEPVVVVQPIVAGVATGLNNDNSSSVPPLVTPGSDIIYDIVVNGQKRRLTGLDAVNAMPAEEYKRRIYSDKTFAKKVDELEAALRKR